MNVSRMVLLAMLLGAVDEHTPGVTCHVCGGSVRKQTGECTRCGAYVCATCSRLHIGEATRECPGDGVEVPA